MTQLREQLVQVLHLHESNHRTALAFALGVGIAFSPTYGLHTASVFLCAWLFRLNFIAILSGSLLNNPWTLVPILGLTFWTGFTLTDHPPVTFELETLSLASIYEQALPHLFSFAVGGVVLSVAFGLLSYPLALLTITRYRARRASAAAHEQPLPPDGRLS